MIYTITFNPALDYIILMDNFQLGHVNRTNNEFIFPGGKGINVSMVLNNLQVPNRALGFIAGFTGDEIERKVKELGVNTDFIKLDRGLSRINIKIKEENEIESEINGGGPEVSEEALEKLYEKLEVLEEGDILVLAGSIPKNMPSDIYESIMDRLSPKKVKFIVDTTGEGLLKVLKHKPFLIKPNHHELEEIFNMKLNSNEEIESYGKKLIKMGAENVIVSMAGEGAILINSKGETRFSEVPKDKVKNSVGAGDSMVGGFIYGYLLGESIEEGFKYGIATGSAAAFSEHLPTKDEVLRLYREVL